MGYLEGFSDPGFIESLQKMQLSFLKMENTEHF